ncbi:MAG: LacI family DNA-binding transcriptional regulator [Roseovarius sp.]
MRNPNPRKPTIADVAREANVARSTVSRAFAKPERLKQETVRHVRQVAERLGFAPNPMARALSTGQSRFIGLIVPDIANSFFPPLFQAAQRKAEESDFDVFLGDSNEDPERELKLIARFGQQVAGMILVSPRLTSSQIKEGLINARCYAVYAA